MGRPSRGRIGRPGGSVEGVAGVVRDDDLRKQSGTSGQESKEEAVNDNLSDGFRLMRTDLQRGLTILLQAEGEALKAGDADLAAHICHLIAEVYHEKKLRRECFETIDRAIQHCPEPKFWMHAGILAWSVDRERARYYFSEGAKRDCAECALCLQIMEAQGA